MSTLNQDKRISILFFIHNYDVGEYMGGIGLRVFELAQVLSEYYIVKILCKNKVEYSYPGIDFIQYSDKWKEIIRESDVVFFNDMPLQEAMIFAKSNGKFIITENAMPIEHLEYDTIKHSPNQKQFYKKIVDDFLLQVSISDYFIARSEIEYCTMLSVLMAHRRITYDLYRQNSFFASLITILPIGFNRFSEKNARRKPVTDNSSNKKYDLIWSGGLWNYMDINTLLSGLSVCKDKGFSPSVLFMYKGDEKKPLHNYQMIKDFISKYSDSNISIDDNIPHSKRDIYLNNTKALICLGKNGIENLTCVRLRIRDTLLYNKPIIVDSYGATANFVRQYNIGYVIYTVEGLFEAIEDVVSEGKRYKKYCKNIQRCKSLFVYEKNIKQLQCIINNKYDNRDENIDVNEITIETNNTTLNEILYSLYS